ncbi:MAG: hypothetical protein RIR74_50 [Pseudomonadota bacterium]
MPSTRILVVYYSRHGATRALAEACCEGVETVARCEAVLRTVLLSALTPLLAWWPLQRGFGLSTATTVVCLAVLSATGTGVTLRALAQAGALNTPSGRLLVGVSVLDDLPAIGLLTLAMALGQPPAAAGGLADGAMGLGTGVTLVLLSLAASRWWRRRHGPWQPGPLGVLLVLIGCSWVGEATGLTSLMGALWGGVVMGRLAPMAAHNPGAQGLHSQLALLSEQVGAKRRRT